MRDLSFEFFQRSPVMAAPLVAMLLFLAVFVSVLVRVLRARREEMDRTASLVLEEESNHVEP